MSWWYFSFINMINFHPHLLWIHNNNTFNLFFFTKNFISCCYHSHFSYFWKWWAQIIIKLSFKLFDYLLIIREMHFLNTSQNKQWLVTHMWIQLSTLKGSCFINWFAWSTVVWYCVWGEGRQLWRDFSINWLHNNLFIFKGNAFEIRKLFSDIFSVSLEHISSFKESVVFGSFINPSFKVSIIVHFVIFNLLLLLSTPKINYFYQLPF